MLLLRKQIHKRFLSIIMAALLTLSLFGMQYYDIFALNAYADQASEMEAEERETQAAITSLEKESADTRAAIKELEAQKKAAEGNVEALKEEKAELASEYNEYATKLDALDSEIEEAEAKLSETSEAILDLYGKIEDNRQKKNELYEVLKKQIKSAYESRSNEALILALMESTSMKDFFNQAEYVSALVKYQRKQLAAYQEIEDELNAQLDELMAKQDELDEYQAILDGKQEEMEALATDVKRSLNATSKDLNSETSKIADYESELADLDKKMKALESQVAAAQAKLAQQIAARLAASSREDTSGSYSASGSELEWLAATIQAEAGGESYTGKLAVGSVIMNRVKSSSFPNTIQGVITQNMQFASYRSGKVELIIANGPNSTCVQAAKEVLNGARVGDYLFFMTKYYADYYGIAEYEMIGNHAFFYRWVTIKKEEPAPENNDANNESSDNNDSYEENQEENQSESENDGSSEENNDESSSEDDQGE